MRSDPLKNRGEWTLVGHMSVDAGLCWIGDPCYVLHKEEPLPPDMGTDWSGFCSALGDAYPTTKEFDLGVCVSTGCGDGTYPVYALIREIPGWGKRVVSVYVDFEGLGEESDATDDDDA